MDNSHIDQRSPATMNTPNDAGNTTIAGLFDLLAAMTREHAANLAADPTLAARLDASEPARVLCAETLLGNRPEINLAARTYDISVQYHDMAPTAESWSAIDMNTYDGAPDAEKPATFIGRGPSAKAARMALLDLFAEYDAGETYLTGLGSSTEPPERVARVYRDPDMDSRDE